MNSVVIYGSHFGNTRKVAEAIAAELASAGPVQLLAADEAPAILAQGTDLLVIGGPIEAFRMTAPVSHLLARLEPQSVSGVAAAAFDTRVGPHWWLPGSAGGGIAKRLEHLGAHVIARPEAFIVAGSVNEAKGQVPALVPGELERAGAWAASLAAAVQAGSPMPVHIQSPA